MTHQQKAGLYGESARRALSYLDKMLPFTCDDFPRSDWMDQRDRVVKEARQAGHWGRLALAESAIYVSTYCNFAHHVKTGRPIGHECRIIPPAALRAEIADDFETAIQILQDTPVVIVRGRPDAR